MNPLDVELSGVVKRFGDFTAVDGIDLRVEAGQFVTLLGPSGCGKTTTLRIIGGLESPDEGTVRVAGSQVLAGKQSGRVTRMVFQDYALFPHMTVAQNVAFGLRTMKVPKDAIEARVAEMADLLGLSGQLTKLPHQMSGGQQQRAAVARALVTRPRVLLLDEPLGALDLKMRKHMQNELKKLQREVGITFVYVTHDQEEALNLSDTVVVMDHGRIVQQGSPVDVYQRPATGYVADFIGEANLIPGRLAQATSEAASVETPFGVAVGHLAPGFRPDAGAQVLVSIRPQHVRFGDDGLDGSPLHRGSITDRAYLGAVTRFSVQMDGHVIRADVIGVHPAAVGEDVVVAWRAEDARVLPADARFRNDADLPLGYLPSEPAS